MLQHRPEAGLAPQQQIEGFERVARHLEGVDAHGSRVGQRLGSGVEQHGELVGGGDRAGGASADDGDDATHGRRGPRLVSGGRSGRLLSA